MRRLSLILMGGALWLILAAVPALADGGPHVKNLNNGSTGITADSCAGCHRAHTAQGPMLLNAVNEEELCLTCHGAAVAGSTVDVETGVQYALAAGLRNGSVQIGAARGGGFEEARIGDPFRYTIASLTGSASRLGKVQVAAAPEPVTSAHIPGLAGITQPGKAWGNGANGSGAGPAATVSCASCHNPHGNGQYRILNTIPATTGVNATWGGGYQFAVVDYGVFAANTYQTLVDHGLTPGVSVTVAGNSLVGPPSVNTTATVLATPTSKTFTLTGVTIVGTGTGGTVTVRGIRIVDYGVAATNVYRSESSMGVLNGDSITITGNTLTGANATGLITMVDGTDSGSTPDDNLFTLSTVAVAGTGTGGAAIRVGGTKVTDAAAPPAGDTRNYTVIQKNSTFTVLSYTGSSKVYTTSAAHNFVIGDWVTVAGMTPNPSSGNNPGINTPNTTAKVETVPSGTEFTLAGVTFASNSTAGGFAVGPNKTLLASQADPESDTAGDYFHYRVPWNGLVSTLDAPNGIPGGASPQAVFQGGFGEQIAAWCASCHTRYWAWSEPTEDTADGAATGPAYSNARPGEDIFKYQHRTRGASGRGCLTCHVSHGSNAVMDSDLATAGVQGFSGNYKFPDGTVSNNSRLLKVDNRGTCQQCHDPTGTSAIGEQWPLAPYPVPSVP